MTPGKSLLRVEDLRVRFENGGELVDAVRGIDLTLEPGQCFAIVGESGSGKSATARALLGLAPYRAARLELDGEDLTSAGEDQWRRVRGRRIGLVLQDALASLDPLRTVGAEIVEAVRNHAQTRTERVRAAEQIVPLLEQVRMPEPAMRARQHPHELSGGQRQRALLASAMSAKPGLLIADEPTTALDTSVQARILDLLRSYLDQGNSVLLISHDLSVVAGLADRIAVMHQGLFVESGPASEVLAAPSHPYTARLLAAAPGAHSRSKRLSIGIPYLPAVLSTNVCSYAGGCQLADDLCRTTCPPRIALAPEHTAWCWRPNDAWTPLRPAPERTGPADEIVVSVREVSKTFRTPGRERLSAVKGVSFDVRAGETLGVVGESGSGKTTLARLLLGLITPDEGEISVLGETWSGRPESQRRALRGRVQLVHQDPLAALDPRLTVERLVGEAFGAPGKRAARRHRDRIAELLGVVGLSPVVLGRLPRQLSGGQRQRVAIARALATDPSVIVCDEPVSALDISIQAQVLDLFTDLRDRLGVALVFISHDFGVINHISDRVLVLQDGSVVESGPVGEVLGSPRHPYTRRLLDDVPSPADAASRHPLEPR